MYFGELAEHSIDYQNGHSMGSVRAFDDAISFFERKSSFDTRMKKKTYTNYDIIGILKILKDSWIERCDTFGMGISEDEEV